MNSRFDLSGRVAVVTGGAQGIGMAIAQALAEQGAAIGLLDLQADMVAAAAEELSQMTGQPVEGLACDTRDKANVDDCIEQLMNRFGRIDVLVNNAGIHRRGTPTDYKPQDLEDVFAVNLTGCYHVAGAVGRVMVSQTRDSIIN